jgi:outer membrane protein OmpA-like peptidoglycan-associated protein
MRSLTKKLKLTTMALATALSFGATAEMNVITHDSDPYLKDQYEIIRVMFLDMEVTQPHSKQIKVIIPTDYGFQTGKATLKRPMKDKIRELAKVLRDYPETTLDIVGHTDNVGTEASNMALGQRRADAVSEVLLDSKVNYYRINAYSEGEELPKCSNKTAKGKECNRRVELNIMLERELTLF